MSAAPIISRKLFTSQFLHVIIYIASIVDTETSKKELRLCIVI